MSFVRRAAAPARTFLRQQPRRYGSSSAGEHHAEPVNETLGRGFYVAVASVPVGLALYKFSTSDAEKKPWITRLIEEYSTPSKTWEERNHLHTMAIERAASDRHLFYSQNPPKTIDLSCPEVFNQGSPINMPAGNSSADLSAVVAHYERKNAAVETQRVAQMKDGKVHSIYEDGRYF